MHQSSLRHVEDLLSRYAIRAGILADIGSMDVNGTYRHLFPGWRYIGVDMEPGPGVDIVARKPYRYPLASESVDLVICGQAFEHMEYFWLGWLEICRIVKRGGLIFLLAPSRGPEHRYPVDCWRFYPDSGRALVKWAERNGYRPLLLESFIGAQDRDLWNDFVAVFARDREQAERHPGRMLDRHARATNAFRAGSEELLNPSELNEDQRRRQLILKLASGAAKLDRP